MLFPGTHTSNIFFVVSTFIGEVNPRLSPTLCITSFISGLFDKRFSLRPGDSSLLVGTVITFCSLELCPEGCLSLSQKSRISICLV